MIKVYQDFHYVIQDDKIRLRRYMGQDENVVIPEYIEGLPVTYVADRVNYNSIRLEENDLFNLIKIDYRYISIFKSMDDINEYETYQSDVKSYINKKIFTYLLKNDKLGDVMYDLIRPDLDFINTLDWIKKSIANFEVPYSSFQKE